MDAPKLPDGPSAPGGASVRALQAAGGEFQVKYGAGYKAQKKLGFARITVVGGINYLTSGKYSAAPAGTFGAHDYYSSFIFTLKSTGINCDLGAFAATVRNFVDEPPNVYSYPAVINGTNQSVSIIERYATLDVRIGTGAHPKPAAQIALDYSLTPRVLGALMVRATEPELLYAGRVAKNGAAAIKLVALTLQDNGRVDSAGRMLTDPLMTFVYNNAEAESLMLPVPLRKSAFLPPRGVFSAGCMYVIIAETFIRTGDRLPTVDCRPSVWLLVSTDGGLNWTRSNIQDPFATDFDIPAQWVAKYNANGPSGLGAGFWDLVQIPLEYGRPAITDTATYSYVLDSEVSSGGIGPSTRRTHIINPFGPHDGDVYSTVIGTSLALMQLVMCGDDAAVASFPYQKLSVTTQKYVWATKVVRISDQGRTVQKVFESADVDGKLAYFQSLVYAGKNTLVAKKVAGFADINLAISFMVSVDGGSTWTENTPSGFGAPLVNQYFGKLHVERPFKDPAAGREQLPARLLITGYDTAKAAYYLYASVDYGLTWKKHSRIVKPNQFYRVDQMVVGDGGGNFNDLEVTGELARTRLVDPALPHRYVRKVSL